MAWGWRGRKEKGEKREKGDPTSGIKVRKRKKKM